MDSSVEDLAIGSIQIMPAKDLYYRFYNEDKEISSLVVSITNTPHYKLAKAIITNSPKLAEGLIADSNSDIKQSEIAYDSYMKELGIPGYGEEGSDYTAESFRLHIQKFARLSQEEFNEHPVDVVRDPVSKVFFIINEPGAEQASFRAAFEGKGQEGDVVVQIYAEQNWPSIIGVSKSVLREEKDTSSQLHPLRLDLKSSDVYGDGNWEDSVDESENIRYGDITKISLWDSGVVFSIQLEYGGWSDSGKRFGGPDGEKSEIILKKGEKIIEIDMKSMAYILGFRFRSNYGRDYDYGFRGGDGQEIVCKAPEGYYLGAIEGFYPLKNMPSSVLIPKIRFIFKRWI